MSNREDLVLLARVAEQTERYEEMEEYVVKFTKLDPKLKVEERNLLSVAFKNVVRSRRSALVTLTSIERTEEQKNNHNTVGKVKAYKNKIEQEILKICKEIQILLEELLIPNSDDDEATIFYLKLKGDYLRYVAEYATQEEKSKYELDTKLAYEEAQIKAEEKLQTTNPIRLGIALNFSAFSYEILNDCRKGSKMAKKAFDEAMADIETLTEDSYKDSTTIMSLLRDNVTLWSDIPEEVDQCHCL